MIRGAARWVGVWLFVLGACSERGGDADAGLAGDGGVDAATADGSTDGARPDACALLCGTSCCAAGEVCEEGACQPACDGVRCGGACCTGDTPLCYGGACIAPGNRCSNDRDCTGGFICEPIVAACVPPPSGAECEYVPPSGVFNPEVEWRVENSILSTPSVGQTTDDNGDGRVDSRDIPDVIFTSGYFRSFAPGRSNIVLYARSGDTGEVVWEANTEWSAAANPAAIGDLEGDGSPEVVASVRSGTEDSNVPIYVGAYEPSARRWKWVTTERLNDDVTFGQSPSAMPVSLADVDGDGTVETFANGRLFDSEGELLWIDRRLAVPRSSFVASAPVIADIDGDGFKEFLGSDVALRYDGTVLWTAGRPANLAVAIADVVGDDGPELIIADDRRFWLANPATGIATLGPIDVGAEGGFGIPTIPAVADYDGDGDREFSIVRGQRIVIIDMDLPAPHILWDNEIAAEVGGRTSVTVFDFDGDEEVEVIANGYCFVEIFRGSDGVSLWRESNLNQGTNNPPLVADIDGDGNAELMTSNTSTYRGPEFEPYIASFCGGPAEGFYPHSAGIRVYGDADDNWVATRRVWNQFTYHINNVTEDGQIPADDEQSWTTHNTYRVNRVENATRAPDLRVRALDANTLNCPPTVTLRALVENQGSRGVLEGMSVAFYRFDGGVRGELLAVGATTRSLLWGEATWVEVTVALPPDVTGFSFVAVADDNGGRGIHSECREDNNQSAPLTLECVELI